MMVLRNRLPWVTFGLLAGILLAFFVRSFAASVVSQVHAEAGTATFTGSTASFSATLTQGGNQPIRTAFGPLRLDYKSGPNAWTTGLLIREGDGNVTIGAGITSADFNSASKLRVLGVVESTTGGFKFPDGTTQTSAAAAGAGNVPNGAMAYFNAACPTGWSEVTAARGRYVVGVPLSGTLAGTSGTALSDLESRPVGQHSHTTTITDPGHQHCDRVTGGSCGNGTNTMWPVGNGICGTSTCTPSVTTGITASTGNSGSVAGTNAPYIQYRVCQYDGNSGADASTWGASGNNIYSINSGNVGIGSTTPGAKLEVAGNINSSTGALQTAGVTRIDNSGVGTLAAGTTVGGIAVCTGAPSSSACLKAVGTGTGSTGNGSIYFLNSSGATRGRFDTGSLSATGGTITYTDSSGLNPRSSPPYAGGYTVHTFTTSGTFTPSSDGNVDVLVVGGGGGGAVNAGGGGGGGLIYKSGHAVSATSYSITVGAGGTNAGGDGGNSVALGLTAVGGGGGKQLTSGANGGSGGGGGAGDGANHPGGTGTQTTQSGDSGTYGFGTNGGYGYHSPTYAGGGGGGAGGAAVANDTTTSRNGGIGKTYTISGTSTTYGGGGGGGAYDSAFGTASGGGGAGGRQITVNSAPVAGTANTGGGGGGDWNQSNGAAGGSGIVIIRYGGINYGTLYLGSTNTSSADLAEYYISGDDSITAGDVVAISNQEVRIRNQGETEEVVTTKGVLRKARHPYDPNIIGIISTNPGVIMGSIDGDTGKKDKRMLALSGRVPVKIDPESPPIAVGDFLTSSTKPGFAMKANKQGYVVGRALEAWDCRSTRTEQIPTNGTNRGCQPTIEAFLSLSYYMGELTEKGDLRTFMADTIKANTVSTKSLDVGGVDVLDRLNKQQTEIDNLKRRLEAVEKR